MTARPLLRCFGIYRRHAWLLAWFITIAAVTQCTGPLVQSAMGKAFDDLVQGVAVRRLEDGSLDSSRALWWAAVLLGANLARGLCGWFSAVVGMILGQRLLSDLRDRIMVQVQALDLGWHQRHGAGEIITRTTRDGDKVRDAVVGGFRQVVEMSLVLIGSFAVLFYEHPMLGIVPVLMVAVAVVIVLSQVGSLVALDRRVGDAYDRVTQDLSEGVIGVRVIKAFALENARIGRFKTMVDGFRREALAAVRYTAVRVPLPQLVVTLGHVWVLGFGAWLLSRGAISIGTLVSAVMIMQAMVFRVEPIGRLMQVFADARSSAGRIMEMLDALPAIAEGDCDPPVGELGLRLRGIEVRSPGGRPVLSGLDLSVAPGETVALVGATGAGKSTLASLLPRLRDPDSGVVEIGGEKAGWHDLRSLRFSGLRRRVQVAFQDGFLFSASLAENLRLADPSADDARLKEALSLAAAEDVLASLPEGLASRIGERGVTLSGGQRQRVCLARALLARPAVICFDDATSALDAVTEGRVLDGLRTELARTAVLIIASKLSTVLRADRVAVLADGRIVDTGTHAELLERSHVYRDLIGIEEAA